MDGGLIAAVVSSAVGVSGAVVIGFARQNRAIGRLEGKLNGFRDTVDAKIDGLRGVLDSTLNAHNQRIIRLEDGENNRSHKRRKVGS